jgi:hypothetical protein
LLEDLIAFVEKLKADRRLATLDEAATKQGVVLPILSKLGWDSFNIDEVVPEYAVGERRVDYALRLRNANKVFIEVKKPTEELEKHQEQLLDYSFKQGVRLAALTNGPSWWFYLPLNEGSWEQRKFYTVDLAEQSSADVVSKFIDFLSRPAVETGKAVENAEAVYKSQQKKRIIREALPHAWDKLILDTEELLIDLLSETAEKLCGYRADAEVVAQFLSDNKSRLLLCGIQQVGPRDTSPVVTKRTAIAPTKGYTGKSIEEFTFKETKYIVESWIDLLLKLCDVLIARHGRDFDRALSLSGRKRPYFSQNPDVLRVPRKLDNATIFVESNLSANSIVGLCFDLVSLFGYSDSDLTIDSR